MSVSSKLDVKGDDNCSLVKDSLAANEGNIVMLSNLPTDILLHIFAICGQDWWPMIAQVCHRFNAILGPDSFLWEQIAKQLLFVNQSSSIFQSK